MVSEIVLQGSREDFENIKKIDENGMEHWLGREVCWAIDQQRNFEEVIGKAARTCIESGQAVGNHFANISEMVKLA